MHKNAQNPALAKYSVYLYCNTVSTSHRTAEAGGVSKGQNMHLYRKRKKCRRPYLRSAACSPAVAAAIADLGGLQEPL